MEIADFILGGSPAAAGIRSFTALAASVNAPLIITGETGTGKGVVASAVHRASARHARPFVAVNCAGVPETLFESEFFGHARGAFTGALQARRGLFEQAQQGTLFLDEIGELDTRFQAKLLTSIEQGVVRRVGAESESRVDVRIIAATSVVLEDAVTDGRFRLDLYHRLAVLSLHLPPLRERGDDRLLLARHFLRTFVATHNRRCSDFADDAVRFIEEQPWPGNIRQLAHAVEAAVLMCDGGVVRRAHFPTRTFPAAAPAAARYSFYGSRDDERERIRTALRRCRGNRTQAARMLGMARNTLRARLAELEMEATTDD